MASTAADQIYQRVRRHIPDISLGTVYRNLQKLVAEGKLQVLTLGRTQHFDPLVDSHRVITSSSNLTRLRNEVTAPQQIGVFHPTQLALRFINNLLQSRNRTCTRQRMPTDGRSR